MLKKGSNKKNEEEAGRFPGAADRYRRAGRYLRAVALCRGCIFCRAVRSSRCEENEALRAPRRLRRRQGRFRAQPIGIGTRAAI